MLRIVSDKQVKSCSYELVERKGIGHPDTICDAIAEHISRLYAQYFYNRYRKLAHHWFDKVMLVGGESKIAYGDGKLIKPYKVFVSGKCVKEFLQDKVPVKQIFMQACTDVLNSVLIDFKPSKDLLIYDETEDYQGSSRGTGRYRPQTIDDLVDPLDDNRVSNDCNLVCAYAPLSKLEEIILVVEKSLTLGKIKKEIPSLGTDVKIIGFREDDYYNLVINTPFIANQVHSYQEYISLSNAVLSKVEKLVLEQFGVKCDIYINPSDRERKPYLTSLGSAADTGDVGMVGRGNRINGIITPMRNMSIEAPAGKNPIDHTGKLYAISAKRIADLVYCQLGVPVDVNIFVSKSTPIKEPDRIIVKLNKADITNRDREIIEAIVGNQLTNICSLTIELLQKGVVLW